MSHGITGRTHLEIGGEKRTLVCDMNAAEVLFQQRGEHWQAWLAERFLGEAVNPAEPHVRRLVPISPGEVFDTLYALLASDREDREIRGMLVPLQPHEVLANLPFETPTTLCRQFGIGDLPEVTAAVMGSVLAGFHIPGEVIEAVVNAVAGPRK